MFLGIPLKTKVYFCPNIIFKSRLDYATGKSNKSFTSKQTLPDPFSYFCEHSTGSDEHRWHGTMLADQSPDHQRLTQRQATARTLQEPWQTQSQAGEAAIFLKTHYVPNSYNILSENKKDLRCYFPKNIQYEKQDKHSLCCV